MERREKPEQKTLRRGKRTEKDACALHSPRKLMKSRKVSMHLLFLQDLHLSFNLCSSSFRLKRRGCWFDPLLLRHCMKTSDTHKSVRCEKNIYFNYMQKTTDTLKRLWMNCFLLLLLSSYLFIWIYRRQLHNICTIWDIQLVSPIDKKKDWRCVSDFTSGDRKEVKLS